MLNYRAFILVTKNKMQGLIFSKDLHNLGHNSVWKMCNSHWEPDRRDTPNRPSPQDCLEKPTTRTRHSPTPRHNLLTERESRDWWRWFICPTHWNTTTPDLTFEPCQCKMNRGDHPSSKRLPPADHHVDDPASTEHRLYDLLPVLIGQIHIVYLQQPIVDSAGRSHAGQKRTPTSNGRPRTQIHPP